jgi:large subunit ribosomal protein L35e
VPKEERLARPNPKPQAYLPLDLRPKKTRALRRALTKEQQNKKLEKEVKRAAAYPSRKFALKA